MEIQPQHINLESLFSNRLFRIPQYQRAYSWETRHRKDLFKDIRQSFDKGEDATHFMATVVGMRRERQPTIFGNQYQVVEIVDGQQRITTLILLLKALANALDRHDAIEKQIGEDLDRTLLKPDKTTLLLLQTNHDAGGFFAEYIRNAKYPQPNTADTLADRQLLSAMRECENFVDEWREDGHSLVELYAHLRNRLTFIFHEISDEGLVYSVFEVLNSRGLEVSWFDRLKSMLMAVVFESGTGNEAETLDEVHRLWSDIYRTVGLRLGLSTESLRFAATLRSENQPSRALGAESAVNTLLEQSSKADEVIDTSSWLLSVTGAVDALRANRRQNAVTQIAHARLVAVAVNLRDDLTCNEKEIILQRWENVTFRIYGIYGKDARTAVGDYVRLAWKIWKEKLSSEQIMSRLSAIGRGYPGNEESVRRELSKKDAYGQSLTLEELRYFFHRYEEYLSSEAGQNFSNEHWNHIWEASAADSIEHIAPQSSDRDYIHWLGNLTMLPPKLNSKLQDKQPKYKATCYVKTGLLDAGDVAKRIETDGKWNKGKIIERENELLKWATQEWAN